MKKRKRKYTKQPPATEVECDVCGHVVPIENTILRHKRPICESCLMEIVEPIVVKPTPGRNDPCPCQSGKKYKQCCGKI